MNFEVEEILGSSKMEGTKGEGRAVKFRKGSSAKSAVLLKYEQANASYIVAGQPLHIEDACQLGYNIRLVGTVIVYVNEARALLDESLQ